MGGLGHRRSALGLWRSAFGLGPWEQGEVGMDTRKIADVKPKIWTTQYTQLIVLYCVRSLCCYRSGIRQLFIINRSGNFWCWSGIRAHFGYRSGKNPVENPRSGEFLPRFRMTGTGVFADFHKALHTFGILFHCCSCSPPVLGTIHKGRPADPVEGGGAIVIC